MNWPPEKVDTPMGVQSFAQASQWHLPTILRDIASKSTMGRDCSGAFASQTIDAAADRIEWLARQVRGSEK